MPRLASARPDVPRVAPHRRGDVVRGSRFRFTCCWPRSVRRTRRHLSAACLTSCPPGCVRAPGLAFVASSSLSCLPVITRRAAGARTLGIAMSGLTLALGVTGAQQPASTIAPTAVTPGSDTSRLVARAVTARHAPFMGGRDDDPVWRAAPPIDALRQREPREDAAPTFRTVAKVAVDARALYVFVRAYDPHPDSLLALLGQVQKAVYFASGR